MRELYELPAGWEWTNLEEICEILDRLRKPVSQKDRISGQYPYYGASGILDYINEFLFDERLVLVGEDDAHSDYVYTEAWIEFLKEELKPNPISRYKEIVKR